MAFVLVAVYRVSQQVGFYLTVSPGLFVLGLLRHAFDGDAEICREHASLSGSCAERRSVCCFCGTSWSVGAIGWCWGGPDPLDVSVFIHGTWLCLDAGTRALEAAMWHTLFPERSVCASSVSCLVGVGGGHSRQYFLVGVSSVGDAAVRDTVCCRNI